jgi:hypothetical protein
MIGKAHHRLLRNNGVLFNLVAYYFLSPEPRLKKARGSLIACIMIRKAPPPSTLAGLAGHVVDGACPTQASSPGFTLRSNRPVFVRCQPPVTASIASLIFASA